MWWSISFASFRQPPKVCSRTVTGCVGYLKISSVQYLDHSGYASTECVGVTLITQYKCTHRSVGIFLHHPRTFLESMIKSVEWKQLFSYCFHKMTTDLTETVFTGELCVSCNELTHVIITKCMLIHSFSSLGFLSLWRWKQCFWLVLIRLSLFLESCKK